MKIKIRFRGTIQKVEGKNKVEWNSPELVQFSLNKFQEGEKVSVTIENQKKNRTLPQNRFYWMYLDRIEKETGNLADDLHEYFKRRFLTPRFVNILGQVIKLPASTTKMSKSDFGQYLDKISAETNIPIPNPEEEGFISN